MSSGESDLEPDLEPDEEEPSVSGQESPVASAIVPASSRSASPRPPSPVAGLSPILSDGGVAPSGVNESSSVPGDDFEDPGFEDSLPPHDPDRSEDDLNASDVDSNGNLIGFVEQTPSSDAEDIDPSPASSGDIAPVPRSPSEHFESRIDVLCAMSACQHRLGRRVVAVAERQRLTTRLRLLEAILYTFPAETPLGTRLRRRADRYSPDRNQHLVGDFDDGDYLSDEASQDSVDSDASTLPLSQPDSLSLVENEAMEAEEGEEEDSEATVTDEEVAAYLEPALQG